jgi:hypothetical protein
MRSLFLVIAVVLVWPSYGVNGIPVDSRFLSQAGEPSLDELRFAAQLPFELPQRISGFAYDGKKFWVFIYQGQGRYATFDPATLTWEKSNSRAQQKVIAEVAGDFQSPGGICFIAGKLWVAGSYGQSFGSIDISQWQIEHLFRRKQRDDPASQSYAAMAYDGANLWIAWHWFKYRLPQSQTQLLLKIDPGTGAVVSEYPLPAGPQGDLTHGLTWDGAKLWHVKNGQLCSIDPSSGKLIASYTLDQVKRPSGLAWDGEALWITEFSGKIWRLPFRQFPQRTSFHSS